jgi:hypothetical protein
LEELRKEYYLEMNESNTFWYLTFIAHREAVLLHLCRLYDQQSTALSLSRFLLTVKARPDFFSRTAFLERLKDNPHVDTLYRAVDESELDKELASVSLSDPLVSRLWRLRNAVIAHTDADKVMKDSAQQWLPFQEIKGLLDRAKAITTKYSLIYRAAMSGGIVGADDYRITLQWVRLGRSSHKAEMRRHLEQIRLKAGGAN